MGTAVCQALGSGTSSASAKAKHAPQPKPREAEVTHQLLIAPSPPPAILPLPGAAPAAEKPGAAQWQHPQATCHPPRRVPRGAGWVSDARAPGLVPGPAEGDAAASGVTDKPPTPAQLRGGGPQGAHPTGHGVEPVPQNQLQVSFACRPVPRHRERLSEEARRLPGSAHSPWHRHGWLCTAAPRDRCRKPPAPAVPGKRWHGMPRAVAKGKPHGGLTSHGWCGPNAPEMFVFPPQGHLVLHRERDGGGFGFDKPAAASGIPRQLEPARLRPATGAILPSPPDPQTRSPSSWSSAEVSRSAGWAGSGAFPAETPRPKATASTSLGHHQDPLPVPAVPARQVARPGRLTDPFPSANCLSGGAGGACAWRGCGIKPGIIR